ncbi:odorant receptor 63a-like isoform X1 [Temnothorax curvispinosus]|uniref:Odorant receptor n=1 Tax=Temnothorax curvispinosus TaxID=300111 RepID=A0A6J1QSI4_9HYME|nr:odorant receptor 63a-like isoform X1 [Temnothorax curvispinosus]
MLTHVLREHNLNKILLSYLGLWPFQNELARSLLPISYLVLQMTCYPLVIIMLYDHWENSRLVFECCSQIVLLTTFVAKLTNDFWNHDKVCARKKSLAYLDFLIIITIRFFLFFFCQIRQLCEAMEKHWSTFTSEFETRVLKDYSLISRKFTILYSIIMFSMIAIFLMVPLTPILLDIIRPLNESRPRFFAVSIEWRIDKDKYFVPIFCYNMSIIVTGTIIMVGIDTMHVTCTVHACSLFSIISQQLEKVISELGIDKLSEQVTYQEYVICLRKYQLALEFVDVLNSMYRTVALIMLLMTGAIISLVGVRIVYVLNQLEEVMRFGLVIIGMLMQLLILCYSGQKLMDESQNVFYRAYAAKWYKFSPRLKSLLIITLYRSFIPCGLTAGNIFSLSMATYATVVRTGISYFTTFLSLKD